MNLGKHRGRFLLGLFILLIAVLQAHGQGLPTGWSSQDVGNVGVAGSASYSNNVFTVTGAGSNLFSGTADAFHFADQPVSGDATIVARVVSVTNSLAQAGVMIRETLNSGATSMSTFYVNGGIDIAYRTTTGGSASGTSGSSVALPYWVKLVRSGSTFTAYQAADGVNWVQVGSSQTIDRKSVV